MKDKPVDRLRVFTINRIAAIKSRQNVQLKNAKKQNKTKPSPKKVDGDAESSLDVLVDDLTAQKKKKLEYEELTNKKSRLTVTSKRSHSKEAQLQQTKLKMIEERQNEKNVLNESINK